MKLLSNILVGFNCFFLLLVAAIPVATVVLVCIEDGLLWGLVTVAFWLLTLGWPLLVSSPTAGPKQSSNFKEDMKHIGGLGSFVVVLVGAPMLLHFTRIGYMGFLDNIPLKWFITFVLAIGAGLLNTLAWEKYFNLLNAKVVASIRLETDSPVGAYPTVTQ